MQKERQSRQVTLASEITRGLRRLKDSQRGKAWPSAKWQRDPVGFCRTVLGVEHLHGKQERILESIRDNPKTAVRSGQKTGKTKIAICAALWFYSSFADARVILTANTGPQVKRVLWRELRVTWQTSREPIDGVLPVDPESGFRSDDGREILGFTTRAIESMAGISGKNLLFIVDEASALSQSMAEAIEGNMAGGARMLWISNPTRSEGPFFEAFHNKREFWKIFHLDSEDIARWLEEKRIEIPGLANLRTIERWVLEYGKDSPFYLVRVKGQFLRAETGKTMTLDQITEAQRRWTDAEGDGVLSIGVDPAGPGSGGDEWVFSLVRGQKQLGHFSFRGLTEDAGQTHLQGFLSSYRAGDETPRVIVDSDGPIGSAFYGRLRALAEHLETASPGEAFEIFGVKGSVPARRQPNLYERTREEVWANLCSWIRGGGAIISDHKLEAELYAPSWAGTVTGKLRLTPKEELRTAIGRSPDRADGLALAVWQPAPWLDGGDPGPPAETEPEPGRSPMDPYKALDIWRQP